METQPFIRGCTLFLNRRAVFALALVISSSFVCFAQSENPLVRITLLHVNDVYQFAPVDGGRRGGLARISTLRKRIQADSPNTLLLLGGDTISPSVESNTYRGKQMIDAWNNIRLDFAVFGNHEFDFGPEVLLERMKESNFTWLGANVIDRKSGRTFGRTPPFVIREFEGVKVGIFGLLLPETKFMSRVGPDIDISDPCEVARRVVSEMRAKGAHVIVGLTHLTMAQDKAVARCAPIDIIIGGHEHTLLQSLSERTPIFKMTSDARELGRFQLNVDRKSKRLYSIDWEVIEVTDSIPEDPVFAPIIAKYGGLLKELAEVVGRTEVALDAESASQRKRETNIGNFVADAYRKAVGADVTILNGGSIRADSVYPPGDLTKRNALEILPFENPVVKLEVKGSTILAALEHGVSRSAEDKEPGRFPQVSGLKFSFDARKPPGSRVLAVTIGDQPLDRGRTYSLATTSFLAVDGGDGYDMFKGARFLVKPQDGPMAPAVLREAIEKAGVIAPRVEGRITRVDKPSEVSRIQWRFYEGMFTPGHSETLVHALEARLQPDSLT